MVKTLFNSGEPGKRLADTDAGATNVENGVALPWAASPSGSYLYYDCSVEVVLDSGVVIHNRLPKVNNAPDTLASVALDSAKLESVVGPGVNLKCVDSYTDVMQRMGHARYWFNLRGLALRVGYKVPIPSIVTIGGVPAVPYDRFPQRASNDILSGANFGSIPLWRARWSLWYTTLTAPYRSTIPTANPAAHLTGNEVLPDSIQVPLSQPDDSVQVGGGGIGGGIPIVKPLRPGG